jgi:hypothetical protein
MLKRSVHLRHVIGIPLKNLRQLARLGEALWAAARTAYSFQRTRDDDGLFGTPLSARRSR